MRITIALVLALVFVLGSMSTVGATPAVDTWSKQLQINVLSGSGPVADTNYPWRVFCTQSYQEDTTYLLCPTAGIDQTYTDDVYTGIDWKKGTATFTNMEIDLTITFNASEALKTGTGKAASYSFLGTGTVVGTILCNGISYTVDISTDVQIAENHYLQEPEPVVSMANVNYNFDSDPYQFDVTGICWENMKPYGFKVEAATGYYSTFESYFTDLYMAPKGVKYPQNFEINCSFTANTFTPGTKARLQVVAVDRNLNGITSTGFNYYYAWGVGIPVEED